MGNALVREIALNYLEQATRGDFNVKITSCHYKNSQRRNKTILQPYFLHSKTSSYWIRAQYSVHRIVNFHAATYDCILSIPFRLSSVQKFIAVGLCDKSERPLSHQLFLWDA